MEIRAFRPIVFTNDSSNIISQFNKLGFESKHVKDLSAEHGVVTDVLKDAAGHSVITVQGAGFPQTFTGIALGVDDFDAAMKEFAEMGYVNIRAEGAADTGSSVVTLLRSPEGLFVSVAQHIK